FEKDTGQFDFVKTTDLGHGACLLISKEVFGKVGLLPEEYFLYYEEHDFTEQAKACGFDVYYVGTSTVYHKESVSVGRSSPLKTYYQARNRILFLKRNSPLLMNLLFWIFLTVVVVPRQTLKYLVAK